MPLNSFDAIDSLKQQESLSKLEEKVNIAHYASSPNTQEEDALGETLYNTSSTQQNQELIIDILRELVERAEKHERVTVTKVDIEKHDYSVKSKLDEHHQQIEETIRLLHTEVKKNSLRHRITVYTSVAVLISTALTLGTLIIGRIVIMAPTASILLFGSILFWCMSRLIPPLKNLPGEPGNASNR